MEAPNGPYQVSYTIESDDAQNTWVITVSAVPTNVAGATRYFGISTAGGGKRVDYVSQFAK
jgi:hypothetical protein